MQSIKVSEGVHEETPFVGALESLRGLAALMVAVGHSMMVLKVDAIDMVWARPIWTLPSLDAKLVKLILMFANGGAAVSLFFVLSGVVLGLSLDNSKLSGVRWYSAFLVRRIFRIFPAYYGVVLFVLLFLFFGMTNPAGVSIASTFFNWSYRTTPSVFEIAGNLSLLNTTLIPIGWTLTTEMVVAVFFPLLYIISRKWPGYAVLSVLLILMLPGFFPAYAGVIILPHIYKFFIGLLLLRYGTPLIKRVFKSKNISRGWFLLAIVILLAERQLIEVRQPGFGFIETAGAALIILGLLHNTPHAGWKMLQWHVIRKLGQQSYSFYLWHFPLLFLISWLMFALLPFKLITEHVLSANLLLCLVSVLVAYRVSALSYKFIEAPFMRTGKRAVTRLFQPGKAHVL
jgi:peptidoglycan/LPS O-acetylase OafA/YrhL